MGETRGSNVRKKSQSLVVLVNDKERIQEVRQKAASNRDKFRNTSAGGMYRPGSQSGSGGYGDRFDEDRYGGRDDERNGYGREREWGYRDEDKMADMETQTAVMGIAMVEIMMTAAEMETKMMIIVEEVGALMIIIMDQEVEVLTGTGITPMMTMVNILLGRLKGGFLSRTLVHLLVMRKPLVVHEAQHTVKGM